MADDGAGELHLAVCRRFGEAVDRRMADGIVDPRAMNGTREECSSTSSDFMTYFCCVLWD